MVFPFLKMYIFIISKIKVPLEINHRFLDFVDSWSLLCLSKFS